MASKTAPAGALQGATSSFAGSALRVIHDVAQALGEGMRARNAYVDLVGQGADHAKAAEVAVRRAMH
jgi:hypothetical protein